MKRKLSILAVSSMIMFSLIGCSNSATGEGGQSSNGEKLNGDEIKIGLLTAFSGAAAVFGPPVKNSAQLAVNEINEAGGLLGKKVVLLEGDTATDPKTASDQAKALLENQKVDALFAETTSAERNAVTPVVERVGDKLFFYNVLYEGGEFSENMYINGEIPKQQISPVYPWIMEQYKGDKWFIVGEDYVWPRKTSESVHKTVEEAGGKVIGEEYVPLGETEYSSLLAKIQSANPDFISLQTNGPAALSFMKQFHAMGLNKSIKVVGLAVDENSINAMGEAGEGLLISAAYFTDLETPENKKFLDNYYKAFGDKAPEPNFITVGTYDAVHQWANAVKEANSLATEEVKKHLSKVSVTGPRGEVSYDEETHHAKLPIYLGEVQSGGKIKVINEFGSIAP